MIAPILGIGWVASPKDFIVTLVEYFHSYETHKRVPTVRLTGPRLIWIRSLASIGGWFKVDYLAAIDHNDDNDYTSTLELQLGKMFTPRVGLYAEILLGDDVLRTDAYDTGVGVGMRFMY